jgi:hypothetical protein
MTQDRMSGFTDSGHSTLLKQRDFKGSFRPQAALLPHSLIAVRFDLGITIHVHCRA